MTASAPGVDISIDWLNKNSGGIVFRVLNDIDGLKVSNTDWSSKVCGLTPKGLIGKWHIIEMTDDSQSECVLVGYKAGYTCRITTTSFVVSMAPDGSALITENGSLYELRDRAPGGPDNDQLRALQSTLIKWCE